MVFVAGLDPDQIQRSVTLCVDVTERMIEAFGVHVPNISETGPFQETDCFLLAPITEGPFPLDPLTRLFSHNGKGLTETKLASQVANVFCMKCRHCRVMGNWPLFQHREPLLLFSTRSLL